MVDDTSSTVLLICLCFRRYIKRRSAFRCTVYGELVRLISRISVAELSKFRSHPSLQPLRLEFTFKRGKQSSSCVPCLERPRLRQQRQGPLPCQRPQGQRRLREHLQRSSPFQRLAWQLQLRRLRRSLPFQRPQVQHREVQRGCRVRGSQEGHPVASAVRQLGGLPRPPGGALQGRCSGWLCPCPCCPCPFLCPCQRLPCRCQLRGLR
jgi:hypothetical protein